MPLTEIEQFLDVIARAVVMHDNCPALARLGMRDIGTTHAGPKWCFVRPEPRFALVIVTVSGRGSVWQGGRWHEVGPDTAYLMPMGAPHGYRVANRSPDWLYTWVRFDSTAKFPELFQSAEPVIAPAASYSLHAANRGLIAEVERGNGPQLVGIWCDLIHISLQRLVRPSRSDPRLDNLWAYVNERLGEPWDLTRMARHANLSREHLRRLCLQQDGTSPRRRLTQLRLRRSCELLTLTNATLFSVAGSVGFGDEFSYSQAFKRSFGLSPSAYRARSRSLHDAGGFA
jgi:AraC family transcriptional regulator of arabinose operon